MEIPLISDIVIILGLSVGVILLFQRMKMPTLLGYLITGTIAGPYGLSLVTASHEVEILAEIGVILLLFVIGMEFSLKNLYNIKRAVLIGGVTQVFISIQIVSLIASLLYSFSIGEAIFLGFLISLSSTAIVLKLLQDKGEINSPHGKISLAILIFQDLIVVPMMLITPLIAGQTNNLLQSILLLLIKGILILILVLVSARYIIPWLLFQVARTKSKELFILSVVVICFAIAWLTSSIGLSLALGAFMAGLIISESEYSHQATSNILPFREIFSSFFFVSIGMLLNIKFFLENISIIIILTLLAIVIKFSVAALAAWVLKYPFRTIVLAGIALSQVGEFAFILSKSGMNYNLLTQEVYQYFLAVSISTMALTPFLIKTASPIANYITKSKFGKRFSTQEVEERGKRMLKMLDLNDHLVIIGYGINGKNLSRAAKYAGIPYIILEINPETVANERKLGEPIIYGDAVQTNILSHVKIDKARVVVIAISDPEATRRIISNIRRLSKRVYTIVRTRFVLEMEESYKLGADEVIPEEFETSIEIFTRVLNKYLLPQNEIETFTDNIRSDNYQMLRSISSKSLPDQTLGLPGVDIVALSVEKEGNSVVGKTIAESRIRNNFNVTLMGIKRDHTIIIDISPDTKIIQNDTLYIFGKKEDIAEFAKKISSS